MLPPMIAQFPRWLDFPAGMIDQFDPIENRNDLLDRIKGLFEDLLILIDKIDNRSDTTPSIDSENVVERL